LGVLRDSVSERAKALAAVGGGGKRVRQELALRDLEEWWLSGGAAAATLKRAGATGEAGSASTVAAPAVLSDEARKGLEAADLPSLYLKLGISIYRALLNSDDRPAFGAGANSEGGDERSEFGIPAALSTGAQRPVTQVDIELKNKSALTLSIPSLKT